MARWGSSFSKQRQVILSSGCGNPPSGGQRLCGKRSSFLFARRLLDDTPRQGTAKQQLMGLLSSANSAATPRKTTTLHADNGREPPVLFPFLPLFSITSLFFLSNTGLSCYCTSSPFPSRLRRLFLFLFLFFSLTTSVYFYCTNPPFPFIIKLSIIFFYSHLRKCLINLDSTLKRQI